MSDKFNVYAHITDTIVAAIGQANGKWQMPWRKSGMSRPANAVTKNRYRGINTIMLWVEGQNRGFGSNEWATYRQWESIGAQVRKGEKSSTVMFFKQHEFAKADSDETNTRLIARASSVFNADQVDGYAKPVPVAHDPAIALDHVDQWVRNTGASVSIRGDRACYIPSIDAIHMPSPVTFIGSEHATPTEAFYSTLLHELGHWTGAKQRLDRNLAGKFGSSSYAIEELVAELTSAFLCADLNINGEPRADHAQYIQSWLDTAKSDKRAIVTAASQASRAAEFLHAFQDQQQAVAA